MMNDSTRATCIEALKIARIQAESWFIYGDEESVARVDAAIADLQHERNYADGAAQEWQPVPSSLEFDLITYAIQHGEIPIEYHICRRVSQE